MTRKSLTLFLATLTLMLSAQTLTAQDATNLTSDTTAAAEEDDGGFWWSASADLASNYIWRGYDQSYRGVMFDPCIQPCVSIGYGKFYIEAWGTASFMNQYHELDLLVGFEHENLLITLYDAYSDFSSPYFKGYNDSHSLTATIDYTLFDRLNLHWSTTFLGDDFLEDGKRAGKRAYSSYFELSYRQPIKELFDITLTAGASPWTAPYWCYADDFESVAKGFNVTNLSLMFEREFEVGVATFPVRAGYIYNPTAKAHYALIMAGVAF